MAREFTGVWIPKHIIEDEDLTMTDRMIYAEIACFNICYKTNEKLGERYGLKANTISIVISKLIKKGYLFSNNKTGEYRELFINPNQRGSIIKIKEALSLKSKRLFEKNQYIDNNIDNIKKTNNFSFSSEKPIKTYSHYLSERRKEKNLPPKEKKKATPSQLKAIKRLKSLDYFHQQGIKNGFDYLKEDDEEANNKFIGLARKFEKRFGDEMNKVIDWWFKGNNAWCDYHPSNFFNIGTYMKYENSRPKKQREEKIYW